MVWRTLRNGKCGRVKLSALAARPAYYHGFAAAAPPLNRVLRQSLLQCLKREVGMKTIFPLLRIWLGDKPVSADLKKALLAEGG